MNRFSYILSITVNVFFATIFQTQLASARWAEPHEADLVVLNFERDITIKADGQSEEVILSHIKILNENGREQQGVRRFQYNGNIQEFEILEAKAIFEGVEYKVPEHMIEKKPLASDLTGFDQLYQVTISFPQIAVGSEIYIKYKEITKKQPLPNYFGTSFNYGMEGLWKKGKVTINSALPLHMLVNDPQKVLEIKDVREKEQQKITMTLKKDIYTALKNESHVSVVPQNLETWVQVSTFDKFEDVAKAFSANYQNVIDQPLPPLLEDIRKACEKISNPVDQINKVTSLLADKVRYMGDWRSIEGRFTPRSLKTISESGVGDCKDFTATTAAILKKLGYESHAALVWRGEGYMEDQTHLPSVGMSNHAMVKAIGKDGTVYWIDPTNMVSMADGIFPDIANRPVFVLNPQDSTYEKIPNVKADHARKLTEEELELKENMLLHTQGKIIMEGEKARFLTGATLYESKEVVEEQGLQMLSGESSALNRKITLPDLTSRIVKNIVCDYSFDQENAVLWTNLGNGVMLDSDWCNVYLTTSDDQVGSLFVGIPSVSIRKILIKNANIENVSHLGYDIKTPWVEAKRVCRAVPEGIEIEETFKALTSYIDAKDIKSPAYKAFKNNLKKYCKQVAVIISSQ